MSYILVLVILRFPGIKNRLQIETAELGIKDYNAKN